MFRKKDMRSLLLVTEGHQGIDTCSPPAGDIAGEQSDGDQQECDDHEGGGISCADTVKQRAKVTRHADGGSDANQGADHSEDESLEQHETEDFAALRTQSGADANFTSAAGRLLRKQADKTQPREKPNKGAAQSGGRGDHA